MPENDLTPRYSILRMRTEIQAAKINAIVRCLDAFHALGPQDSLKGETLIAEMRRIIEEIKNDR